MAARATPSAEAQPTAVPSNNETIVPPLDTPFDGKLILQDGTVMEGYSFGAKVRAR